MNKEQYDSGDYTSDHNQPKYNNDKYYREITDWMKSEKAKQAKRIMDKLEKALDEFKRALEKI